MIRSNHIKNMSNGTAGTFSSSTLPSMRSMSGVGSVERSAVVGGMSPLSSSLSSPLGSPFSESDGPIFQMDSSSEYMSNGPQTLGSSNRMGSMNMSGSSRLSGYRGPSSSPRLSSVRSTPQPTQSTRLLSTKRNSASPEVIPGTVLSNSSSRGNSMSMSPDMSPSMTSSDMRSRLSSGRLSSRRLSSGRLSSQNLSTTANRGSSSPVESWSEKSLSPRSLSLEELDEEELSFDNGGTTVPLTQRETVYGSDDEDLMVAGSMPLFNERGERISMEATSLDDFADGDFVVDVGSERVRTGPTGTTIISPMTGRATSVSPVTSASGNILSKTHYPVDNGDGTVTYVPLERLSNMSSSSMSEEMDYPSSDLSFEETFLTPQRNSRKLSSQLSGDRIITPLAFPTSSELRNSMSPGMSERIKSLLPSIYDDDRQKSLEMLRSASHRLEPMLPVFDCPLSDIIRLMLVTNGHERIIMVNRREPVFNVVRFLLALHNKKSPHHMLNHSHLDKLTQTVKHVDTYVDRSGRATQKETKKTLVLCPVHMVGDESELLCMRNADELAGSVFVDGQSIVTFDEKLYAEA